MSLNGLRCVFSEIQRLPSAENEIRFLAFVAKSRTAACAGGSPLARFVPLKIWRPATFSSALSTQSISSR